MTTNYRTINRANAPEWWETIRKESLPILDVRSPCEYAKGSVPNSINSPLFSDEQRAAVGTTYKEEGRLTAIQLGLEILSGCVNERLDSWTKELKPNAKFAIYCARGGLRSYSVALYLKSLGYRPMILNGGYKSFRGYVIKLINELAEKKLLVVVGCTGVGKTLLLRKLTRTTPSLDFESYAHHRGSAFGDLNQSRAPATQQNFENSLAEAYLPWRDKGCFIVEMEDAIGPVKVPGRLRQKLRQASMLQLTANLPTRVQRIADEYVGNDCKALTEGILRRFHLLAKHLSTHQQQQIRHHINQGEFKVVIELLLTLRYDKMYQRSLTRHQNRIIKTIDCTDGFAGAEKFVKQYLTQ